jgi:hypothetical protein
MGNDRTGRSGNVPNVGARIGMEMLGRIGSAGPGRTILDRYLLERQGRVRIGSAGP